LLGFEDGYSRFESSDLGLKSYDSTFVEVLDIGDTCSYVACQEFSHNVNDDVDTHTCRKIIPLICSDGVSEALAYTMHFVFKAI
jgi:hypothetical protein